MSNDIKAQCGSKQFLIDQFKVNDSTVRVYLTDNKHSIKQYCRDTVSKEGIYWITFKEAFRNYYREMR